MTTELHHTPLYDAHTVITVLLGLAKTIEALDAVDQGFPEQGAALIIQRPLLADGGHLAIKAAERWLDANRNDAYRERNQGSESDRIVAMVKEWATRETTAPRTRSTLFALATAIERGEHWTEAPR